MDSVLQSMEKVLFSESKSDMKGMLRRLSIPTGRENISDLPKFLNPIVGKQPSTPATPSSISPSLSRPANSRPPFFNRAALKTRLRPLVAAALSSQQSATISLDSKVDMLRKLLAEQTPPHIRTHLMSKQFAEHARTLFLQQQSISTTRTFTTTPPTTTTVSSTTAIPTSSPIPHTTRTTIKSTILRQLLPSAKPSSSTTALPTAVNFSSSNELQSLLKIRPVQSSMAAAPSRIKILQRKLSVDSDINDSEGFTPTTEAPTTSTTATTLTSVTSSASLDIKLPARIRPVESLSGVPRRNVLLGSLSLNNNPDPTDTTIKTSSSTTTEETHSNTSPSLKGGRKIAARLVQLLQSRAKDKSSSTSKVHVSATTTTSSPTVPIRRIQQIRINDNPNQVYGSATTTTSSPTVPIRRIQPIRINDNPNQVHGSVTTTASSPIVPIRRIKPIRINDNPDLSPTPEASPDVPHLSSDPSNLLPPIADQFSPVTAPPLLTRPIKIFTHTVATVSSTTGPPLQFLSTTSPVLTSQPASENTPTTPNRRPIKLFTSTEGTTAVPLAASPLQSLP